MSALDLSRWQFGITTVYHFIFVPLTLGLSILVACMQTAWVVKKDPAYLRLTKFFGKLFLINFAVGVVTGIVQEFQFGMNWSAYSRFVGDVFGAPLAMEGLLAFFLESTFLGLWIFGWNRLSPRLHLATIRLASGPRQPDRRPMRPGLMVALAAGEVITSMTVFTLLYAALPAIAGWLMIRHIQAGAPEEAETPGAAEPQPVFTY